MAETVKVELELKVFERYRGFTIVETGDGFFDAIYQGKVLDYEADGFGHFFWCQYSKDVLKTKIDEFVGNDFELCNQEDCDHYRWGSEWVRIESFKGLTLPPETVFRRKVAVEQDKPEGLQKTYDTLTEVIANLEQLRAMFGGGE